MTRSAEISPAPLPDFDPSVVVDLDVREELLAGREPLARILAAADALAPGAVLHVRSPFQPTPLFAVLARLGFEFNTESFAADDWSSWFWRDSLETGTAPISADTPPAGDIWDLRNLSPPEPLRLLLERVAGAATSFDVLVPAFSELIPGVLADRGWRAEVIDSSPSGTRVRIAKRGRDGTAANPANSQWSSPETVPQDKRLP